MRHTHEQADSLHTTPGCRISTIMASTVMASTAMANTSHKDMATDINSTRTCIKIAAEHWVPWTKIITREDGSIDVSGPTANLLHILADKLNFDYELVRPPDGYWGAEKEDGSWSGMIGMLHREEVELALGPFTVTPQRESVSDFTVALQNDNKAILMVRPGLQSDVSGFLKPFTTEVWLLILVSLLGVGCVMVMMVRAEEKVFGTFTKNIISKASMWVLQTVTQESSEWLPEKDGGRLIVTTWLLASLVFMSSYSGILTAMLTLPRVTIPIDSLGDLVAQSDLPWRLEHGSMIHKFLLESGDPVRQKAVTGMSGTFPDCWSAREAIANGEFAAICDETTMKKAMSWDFSTSGRCHLYIGREKVFTSSMFAMAFRTNSTLLPRANKIIRLVKEAGLLAKWLGSEITNTTQCLRPPSSDRRDGISALNLDAFLGPLLVLSGGMTLALLVFLGEHIGRCLETKSSQ